MGIANKRKHPIVSHPSAWLITPSRLGALAQAHSLTALAHRARPTRTTYRPRLSVGSYVWRGPNWCSVGSAQQNQGSVSRGRRLGRAHRNRLAFAHAAVASSRPRPAPRRGCGRRPARSVPARPCSARRVRSGGPGAGRRPGRPTAMGSSGVQHRRRPRCSRRSSRSSSREPSGTNSRIVY